VADQASKAATKSFNTDLSGCAQMHTDMVCRAEGGWVTDAALDMTVPTR
jgi:hypothetical protein